MINLRRWKEVFSPLYWILQQRWHVTLSVVVLLLLGLGLKITGDVVLSVVDTTLRTDYTYIHISLTHTSTRIFKPWAASEVSKIQNRIAYLELEVLKE